MITSRLKQQPMTKKEAKVKALTTLWGWATNHCEGIEKGELSDVLSGDVHSGRFTESEAKKIQKAYFDESERIINRLRKLKNNNQ